MIVHITSTPEFPIDQLIEIVSFLQDIKGELEFKYLEPFNTPQYSFINEKFNDIDKIENLTFKEFFHLIGSLRTFKNIPDDEFVVIITSIKNNKDWFSAFEKRNIFVNSENWEYYTKRDSKFGISYQIVENIFQSLIELNIDDIDNEPNIHMESIGCINDMCDKEKEVLLKLRTADICDSCIDRAFEKNIDPLVLDHIKEIIENIRKEFVNSNRIKSKLKPLIVHIDPNREIKIGDKSVDVHDLSKVLFIFFLKNLQGIKTQFVDNHKKALFDIYKEVRKNAEEIRITRMFYDVDKKNNPTFDSNKSKLNAQLVNQLGASLAEFYIIDKIEIKDDVNLYKINIEEEFVKIDPKN